jgi:hypothetical protein
MGSEITGAFVGLGLDDASDLAAGRAGADEMQAKQVARDEERFAGVEGEGKESS